MGGEYSSPLFFSKMVVLALDTSTPAGSVALARDTELLGCRSGDPARTHGERLPGDLLALLAEHGLAVGDVDVFAACCGPGSFTGLRVGLATVQALALVNGRQLVTVPTLEAVARAARLDADGATPAPLVGAWMNAHRGEVFAALYEAPPPARAEPLAELAAPVAAAPEVVARQWAELLRGDGRQVAVIGDAVEPARPLLERELDCSLLLGEDLPPLAPIAAGLAAAGRAAGSPHAARPVYVRRPDAELARLKLR